jgi:hypothetical protein
VSDIDTVLVASLKALDPERPIREADISTRLTPLTSFIHKLEIDVRKLARSLKKVSHLSDLRYGR